MLSVACEMPFYGTGDCNMLSKKIGGAVVIQRKHKDQHESIRNPPHAHGYSGTDVVHGEMVKSQGSGKKERGDATKNLTSELGRA